MPHGFGALTVRTFDRWSIKRGCPLLTWAFHLDNGERAETYRPVVQRQACQAAAAQAFTLR
jgi:hypothetical protein